MCGLIAIFSLPAIFDASLQKGLVQMKSRGPDEKGEWKDAHANIGHPRLAILGLDPRSGLDHNIGQSQPATFIQIKAIGTPEAVGLGRWPNL